MAKSSRSKGKAAAPLNLFATAASALEPLRAAKREWSRRLLWTKANLRDRVRAFTAAISPKPEHNVVGVGIGEKVVDEQPTGLHALKFFVRVKLPETQLSADHVLPRTVNGLPTDVEESGLFRRFPTRTAPRKRKPTAAAMPDPRVKIRPAQPGCSIGFRDPSDQFVMAGTFGALVRDGGDSYVLSNNHVLADEGRLPIGSPIFQPGLLDEGNPNTDQIAELTRFGPLQAGTPNKVDCALARALKPSLVSRDILYIGPPKGAGQAALDMVVHKFGRTTSYRVGRITSLDTDVSVQYETGTYTFESQIIVVGMGGQSFSDAGDSGSLILERDTQLAVALLFAGSTSHTIANHLEDVLQAMNVQLA
jgi:hypothetical protein